MDNRAVETVGTDSTAPFTRPPPGFRLPAELGLGPVRLEVADLERSVDYYEHVIGLRALGRDQGRVALAARQDNTPLIELEERPGATPVPRRGRLGLYHFALLLPNRSDLARFLGHLAAIGVYPGMSDHLVSEALYLSDPDGLGIEVYADRPRKSWRINGSVIAMATDPLNVENLLAAAGNAPWAGAPAGTRIGHIHLHVGDLEQASAFFHAALGLDQVILGFPGARFFSAGGYHHHLGTNTWAADAAPASEGDARLLEWTIRVPGAIAVEGAANSLTAAGYPTARENGDAVSIDPWGTRVRITATS